MAVWHAPVDGGSAFQTHPQLVASTGIRMVSAVGVVSGHANLLTPLLILLAQLDKPARLFMARCQGVAVNCHASVLQFTFYHTPSTNLQTRIQPALTDLLCSPLYSVSSTTTLPHPMQGGEPTHTTKLASPA